MREPDVFDRIDADEEDPILEVHCRRCGAEGLYWQRVTRADGRGEESVLFAERTHRRHVCDTAAAIDDFDVVTDHA